VVPSAATNRPPPRPPEPPWPGTPTRPPSPPFPPPEGAKNKLVNVNPGELSSTRPKLDPPISPPLGHPPPPPLASITVRFVPASLSLECWAFNIRRASTHHKNQRDKPSHFQLFEQGKRGKFLPTELYFLRTCCATELSARNRFTRNPISAVIV